MSLFHASILTIFPEMFLGPLQYSLAGKALEKNIWSSEVINLRDFGITKHKKVDDCAYGGGNGLIMRPDVIGNALDHALSKNPTAKIFYPSPRGKLLNQQTVKDIIKHNKIIILCGRFEGVDERVIDEYNATEISIGDYILSGGEMAALVILDCCIRLLQGVLINQDTLRSESFERQKDFASLLEHPLYTKPFEWKGRKVPEVLLTGNHKQIEDWRFTQSLEITKKRRSDLISNRPKA